jgi:hypothetical protein
MRARCLIALLVGACGATPTAACRSNDECPSDRVCIAGTCGVVAGPDGARADASVDSGSPNDADVDASTASPPGESCASPILLRPVPPAGGGSPVVRWDGELGDYADDAFPDCSSPDTHAPDIVFEIERPIDVADILVTTSPASLDTVMAIDDSCDGQFSWACNDDRDPNDGGGGDVSSAIFLWHFRQSAADHLYLIVDGGRSTVRAGAISVQVEVRAASTGTCDDALDLSGGGTVLAFPSGGLLDRGNCTDPIGPDVIFGLGDGSDPVGRIAVDSSDFPVSLRLIAEGCGLSSTLCAPRMGSASYAFSEIGPLSTSGLPFVAVEGVMGPDDGTFNLDYDP